MNRIFAAILAICFICYPSFCVAAYEEGDEQYEQQDEAESFSSLKQISGGQYLFVTRSQMISAGYRSSDEFREAVIDSCMAMEGASYSQKMGKGGQGEPVDCITYVLIAYASALNKITNLNTTSDRLVHFAGSCKSTGPWKLYTKTGSTGCTSWLSMHGIGTARYSDNVFKQGAPVYESLDPLDVKRGEIVFFGGYEKSSGKYKWLHTGIYDGEGSMFWQARGSAFTAGVSSRTEFDDPEQTRYTSVLVLHIEDFDLTSDAELLHSSPAEYSSYKWIQRSGKWYCRNSKGEYITGLAGIGKKYYLFDGSGVMKTGWQMYGGYWFYCSSSGAVKTGWAKLSNKWYLFSSCGIMLTGLNKQGGSLYYLDRTGKMITGWRLIDGSWYYFKSDGAACVNCWKKLGSTWYFFDKNGVMLTGINKIYGKYYLMDENGAMRTGWTKLGDEWYYNLPSGEAVSGEYSVDGVQYLFDEQGRLLEGVS